MAVFKIAFDKTMVFEGGYSNRANDWGGETFLGISRKHNPDWPGWLVIDRTRKKGVPDKALCENEALGKMAEDLYRRKYWDVFGGDALPSQLLADNLFDIGVNMGRGFAVRIFQESLNLLNRSGKIWDAIEADGAIGPKTLHALDRCLKSHDERYLIGLINLMRGERYLNLVRLHPEQSENIRGWIKRVMVRV